MASSYDREYFEGIRQGPHRGYDTPFKAMTLQRYFQRLESARPIAPGERVLDIGCAYGLFLSLYDARGCETHGIDISEYAIEKARSHTKARLRVGSADEPLPYPDSYFRLVTLFDVIEHLVSPSASLQEIRRVLEPGGCVAITTLNEWAASRFVKPSDCNIYRDPSHRYLFDPSSLKFTVEQAGFKVLSIRTPFHSLPTRLSAFLERTGMGGQLFCIAAPNARLLLDACPGPGEESEA